MVIGKTTGAFKDHCITAVTLRKYKILIILHEVIVASIVVGIFMSPGFHAVVIPGWISSLAIPITCFEPDLWRP